MLWAAVRLRSALPPWLLPRRSMSAEARSSVWDAATIVLMNMLGLVCDPVGGLVEYPCQNPTAAGVANALIAAEMALAGLTQLIPSMKC